MSVWPLTYQQSVFKRCHCDKLFSEFLPTTWRQKSTGIDMERNYVTVTLCISFRQKRGKIVSSPRRGDWAARNWHADAERVSEVCNADEISNSKNPRWRMAGALERPILRNREISQLFDSKMASVLDFLKLNILTASYFSMPNSVEIDHTICERYRDLCDFLAKCKNSLDCRA